MEGAGQRGLEDFGGIVILWNKTSLVPSDWQVDSFGRAVGFPDGCTQFNNYSSLLAPVDPTGPMRAVSLPVIAEQFYTRAGVSVFANLNISLLRMFFIRLEVMD